MSLLFEYWYIMGNNIRNQATEIKQLLLDNRLKEALEKAGILMEGITDWSVTSRYEELDMSYKYMMRYFSMGRPDNQRNALYNQLISRTLLLTDDIMRQRLLKDDMSLYFQHSRLDSVRRNRELSYYRKSLESFNEDTTLPAYEQTLSELFDFIWTSTLWSNVDKDEMMELIDSPFVKVYDLELVISAITLSLMDRFDPEKLSLLITVSNHIQTEISVRATVGMLLTIIRHHNIIHLFPAIISQISLLSENSVIEERIYIIQTILLLSKETNKIDKKMREEIIPAMLRNPKLGGLSNEDISIDDDANPDWSEWMEKSGVKDKLMEMTELQMEGADVYMSTFSNLKSYPFFRDIANWFRPFRTDIPGIIDESLTQSTIGRAITDSYVFCNSDKYSFCFTFSQIPESQRGMLVGQIEGANELEQIEKREKQQLTGNAKFEVLAKQYVQDLYRFFKLFSRRHEFTDMFSKDILFLHNNILSELLKSNDKRRNIAEYLIKKKYYAEGAEILSALETTYSPAEIDYQFYQKLGYAYQRSNNYQDAIESYNRSDILRPDNLWTMRHLAQCYRLTGQPKEALQMLLAVESSEPDNMTLQMQIGQCYVELGNYEQALNRFYKVEYMQPDSIKAWRAIAWCAFLSGNREKSIEYYDRLCTMQSPSAQDYLNAGHLYWVIGEVENAVSSYRKCAEQIGIDSFISEFDKDFHLLKKNGVTETDYPIMIDLIR